MPDSLLTDSLTGASSASERTTLTEGVSFELRPAPFWKRVLALAVDYGIITTILYGAFLVIGLMSVGMVGAVTGLVKAARAGGLKDTFGAGGIVGAILVALLVLVVLLGLVAFVHVYFIAYEYKRGATPGKKMFGLKVISLRQSRLTLGQCALREAIRLIELPLVLPALISVLSTKRKQRLGDLAAGAVVVYSAEKEAAEQSLYVSRENFDWFFETCRPKPVPLDVAKDFLAFAYPHFILRKPLQGSEAVWKKVALDFVEAPQAEMDDTSLLLYFAEHCFRSVNQQS